MVGIEVSRRNYGFLVAHAGAQKTHSLHQHENHLKERTMNKPIHSVFDSAQLTLFTGTDHYYRLSRLCVITDGVKYMADVAGAYWLVDAAASYLLELGTADWFVLVRLVACDGAAVLTLEDGNGGVRAQQMIPYTDFPIAQQLIYAVWDGANWVLMLPSEY